MTVWRHDLSHRLVDYLGIIHTATNILCFEFLTLRDSLIRERYFKAT